MSPWALSVQTWIAAFVTLTVLSYVFKDNLAYRLVQHAALGITTAFMLVLTCRDVLQPQWMAPIIAAAQGKGPALDLFWLLLLVPGVLWYFQLSRTYYWVSLPVTGLFIGVAAGVAFKVQLQTVMPQIAASIKPLNPWALPNPGSLSAWLTVLNNALFIVVLLTALLYFFFSIRTDRPALRGPVRFGRLAIMLTLGAMFACTVMTRTSYLLDRLRLIYTDWIVGQLYKPVAALFGAHG
jgi:hypothetical protein